MFWKNFDIALGQVDYNLDVGRTLDLVGTSIIHIRLKLK